MENKKKYEAPTLELVKFESEDIITTSAFNISTSGFSGETHEFYRNFDK